MPEHPSIETPQRSQQAASRPGIQIPTTTLSVVAATRAAAHDATCRQRFESLSSNMWPVVTSL
jgi:hypothetical protein